MPSYQVTDHTCSPGSPRDGYTGWRAGCGFSLQVDRPTRPGVCCSALQASPRPGWPGAGAMKRQPIFVSHSHEDNSYCRELVAALRAADADVWYDEQNLGSGRRLLTIERELRARPIFVVILSPAALASDWVRDESSWAYTRPASGCSCRISSASRRPVVCRLRSPKQRARRCARSPCLPAIARTNPRIACMQIPATIPWRARALYARNRHVEALAVLDRAALLTTEGLPSEALALRAHALNRLGQPAEALATADRALAARPNQVEALLA